MDTIQHPLPGGKVLELRQAQPQDAAAVLDFVHAVCAETDFLTFGPGEFEMTVEQEAQFLSACLEQEGSIYVLASIDGQIVGTMNFAAGRRPRTRHCGSFGISVLRKAWGQGVGTRLLEVLLDWARAGGVITKINLSVRTDNTRAIKLYERKGFVLEGTTSREMCIDGQYFDTHWMGLEI